ncbi:MAG: 4-demethylwyosine synthase TYW1 [Candidatus Aenigmarchaeota archaeon]|nr:4-demethylwyosine synthase TYW1 [Candidatus Aenigmarchaeota archaeon]
MNDKKRLEKMGYRFGGKNKHAAVKICEWTRESLRGKGVCYKEKFYGIKSHRCLQMAPGVNSCNHKCAFCWRDINITNPKWNGPIDEPEVILNKLIEEQRKLLMGFKGFDKTDMKKFKEAMEPNQVAISLAGEPCLYPKLPELVDLINNRKMTSFLVTNGTIPEMVKKLEKHQPYQLYVTLAAPNEEIYKKTCGPMIKNGWKKIMKTLSLLKKFKRTVIRLTLCKNLNMINPEEYAKIIEKAKPKWIECKAYMSIGYSRDRLGPAYMPTHEEIKKFAKEIEKHSSYKIVGDQKASRVVLLTA